MKKNFQAPEIQVHSLAMKGEILLNDALFLSFPYVGDEDEFDQT